MYSYRNDCLPIIKSQSVTVEGGSLLITVPTLHLLNGKGWRLVICQAIPDSAATLPVQIVVNGPGTTLPLLTNLGNTMRGDMLRPRKVYKMYYGWDAPHMIILSCNLCESTYIPTTAATPSPSPAAAEVSAVVNESTTNSNSKKGKEQ